MLTMLSIGKLRNIENLEHPPQAPQSSSRSGIEAGIPEGRLTVGTNAPNFLVIVVDNIVVVVVVVIVVMEVGDRAGRMRRRRCRRQIQRLLLTTANRKRENLVDIFFSMIKGVSFVSFLCYSQVFWWRSSVVEAR